MLAHVKEYAEYTDQLARHNGGSIDTLLLSVLRNEGSLLERAKAATTVIGWHSIVRPYKPEQEHYLNTERLMRLVRSNAHSLWTFAVYIDGTLDPEVDAQLRLLDESFAEGYVDFCLAFAYESLRLGAAPENVTANITLGVTDD